MDAYNVNTIYLTLNISDSGMGIAQQINHKTYSLTTCSDTSQGLLMNVSCGQKPNDSIPCRKRRFE